MGPFSTAIAAYKKAKHEQKEKSRLLSKDIDYTYLQKMLNSLADNPNKLMIVIKLANGTTLEIKRQEKALLAMRDPYTEVLS